jgi:hypothetical protein
MDPELIYITLVEMDQAYFPSAFHMGEQTVGDTINLPITIYDVTTDTSSLNVSRLHAFFQFTSQGTVQVIHQVSISNRDNKMVASERDIEPILNFTLPEGASNLIFQAGTIGNPYIQTVDGFADPTPIMPGESSYEILFAYELPFERTLDWQIPMDLSTDVAVIFVQGETVKVESDILQSSGLEALEKDVFQVMIANNLLAGDIVDLQLSTPIFDGSGLSGLAQNQWFTIILGLIGLGLAGFGAWRFFVPAQDEPLEDEDDRDSLIDAIVALDEEFEAGNLEEDDYQEKREALKSELRNLLDEEDAA